MESLVDPDSVMTALREISQKKDHCSNGTF
jgi:hypothetical protein